MLIRAEHPPFTRLSCVHEEMAQAMGLPNDSPEARPSLFNDDLEFALLTEHDAILLRMLYDPRLRPGMTSAEARPLLPGDRARRAPGPGQRRAADASPTPTERETPMPIFDFLRGEFIDVIAWTDDTRDTIVARFEREGHAIKYGAKLTVREGQAAVFVHEGQLADTFGPGLYELETNNLPILTTLQHWDHGFRARSSREIYFVNTRLFTDLKWGTRNPITCRDKDFGMVRLRAYGTYTMRVADPAKFLTEIVGTDGEFTTEEIEFQIRNLIVTHFSQIIATSRHPGARHGRQHARARQDRARADRADGRRVRPRAPRLHDREHLAARRGRGGARQAHRLRRRGRPLALHRVQRRRGADHVGRQPRRRRGHGRRPRHGRGHGDGRAHGAHRPLGRRARGRRRPRRRRPAGKRWHVAVDGKATGPYTRDELGRMVADGTVTGDSWLWTPGGPDWQRGRDVTELADLFSAPPPPPAS